MVHINRFLLCLHHIIPTICELAEATTLQDFSTYGLDHLKRSLSSSGLSSDVVSSLLKDVDKSSIRKYQAYWARFTSWCVRREVNTGSLTVNSLCKFFIYMFDTGLSASTLKFIRSSLSFFLRESHGAIIDHHFISRLLKSFEKMRPTVPRYVVTWD